MKNTDPAALKGYDVGKKVSGIKRHIAVDTQGLPHAVAATTADVTYRKGALERCKPNLSRERLRRPAFRAGGARDSGRACDGADRQEERTAHLQGHAQALDRRAQLCLAGQESVALEELRAAAQHQPAVRPLGVPGSTAQESVNRL